MNYIIYVLLYLLGWFICSFAIGNILLLLFFSIPYTNKLHKNGVINNKQDIIKLNIVSLFIQFVILFVTTFLVYKFANTYLVAYFIGMIIPFFLLLRKIKESPENISDYMSRFGQFVDITKINNIEKK